MLMGAGCAGPSCTSVKSWVLCGPLRQSLAAHQKMDALRAPTIPLMEIAVVSRTALGRHRACALGQRHLEQPQRPRTIEVRAGGARAAISLQLSERRRQSGSQRVGLVPRRCPSTQRLAGWRARCSLHLAPNVGSNINALRIVSCAAVFLQYTDSSVFSTPHLSGVAALNEDAINASAFISLHKILHISCRLTGRQMLHKLL